MLDSDKHNFHSFTKSDIFLERCPSLYLKINNINIGFQLKFDDVL